MPALDAALDRVLAAGADAVERTPQLLAVLQEAGVVDAGGAGLLEIARGAVAGLRGEQVAAPEAGPAPLVDAAEAARVLGLPLLHDLPGRGRRRSTASPSSATWPCSGTRWSWWETGTPARCTSTPTTPARRSSLATAVGVISGVEIADMHAQTDERRTRLAAASEPDAACDVVCVVAGAGNRALVESLGCRSVVEGGQTMNPSTRELVDAIEACRAAEVVVLPNNPNVLLTAEQAAEAVDRAVRVVPTRSIPAGLAAMVAFDAGRDAAGNARAMQEAAAAVRTGELTTAVRDATADGVAVHQGDYLALVDGRIVASKPAAEAALQALADQLLDGGAEILTVLRGEGCGDLSARLQAVLDGLVAAHPGLDIEIHEGGQPHYPMLLSAE